MQLIARLDLASGPELTWLLGEARELVAIFGSTYRTARRKDAARRSTSAPRAHDQEA